MVIVNINWSNISDAIKYYEDFGYTYIETPWIVNTDMVGITCESNDHVYTLNRDNESLVGSAEQGFFQLLKEGKLSENVFYVSAGPCFRREPILDELHCTQFFKVELGAFSLNARHADRIYREFMFDAKSLMRYSYIEKTESGTDLLVNGIEVGSYGVRKLNKNVFGKDIWWIYGTGLAEPRYSIVRKKVI